VAHTATARDGAAQEFDQKEKRPTSRGDTPARLFIGAGKRSGIRPADLVGAIAGETGVPGNMLGP
jgi:ATP-dependent RNA helicase DeaD